MAGGSESSSPPNWAQSLMQQIAQSHARQENVIQTQENAIQAQDERIERLEALLRSAITPNEPTPNHQRTAVQRPRITTAAVEESNQSASVSTLKKKTSWRSKTLRAATPSHDEESSENE